MVSYFSRVFILKLLIIANYEFPMKIRINLKRKPGVYRCTDGNQSVHDESSI